ncbi:MAG: hypothetical protein RLZZ117_2654 [Cyanobacteriota bacterium]|jgi:hypothetical protein
MAPGTVCLDQRQGTLVCMGFVGMGLSFVGRRTSGGQNRFEFCRMEPMNASDQARSVELAQAIASVVLLFRGTFPDARANLTPWRDDPLTRQFDERESVDLSFHFPGWSPRLECRSLLVQLRLERPPRGERGGRPRLLGVLLRGLTYESERWRLATVGDWRPSGSHLPCATVVADLQGLCRELFTLFEGRGQDEERQRAA